MENKVILFDTVGRIREEMLCKSDFQMIGDYPLAIIKSFLGPPSELDNYLTKIVNWRKTQPLNGENDIDRLTTKRSYVRRDTSATTPQNVLTQRLFDCYQISTFDDDALSSITKPIVSAMRELDDAVSGKLRKNIAWLPRENLIGALRPQILHYPGNGGFFDWHTHALVPQRYGLILEMSKKGRDYDSGGTSFKLNRNVIVNSGDYADQTDVILFRYDLEHKVGPFIKHCMGSETDPFDFGRFSFIMPII